VVGLIGKLLSGGAIPRHARSRQTRNQSRQCPFGFCLLCSINDLTINLLIKSAQGQSEYKNDLPHAMNRAWQDACTQAVRTSIRDGWQKTSRKPVQYMATTTPASQSGQRLSNVERSDSAPRQRPLPASGEHVTAWSQRQRLSAWKRPDL
jgi:hypothetical protein